MSRRKSLAVSLVCVALAVAGGAIAARSLRPNNGPAPEPAPFLHVDPASLDFGEVWATDQFIWRIPVTNRSDDEVILEQLKGDCSCVSLGEFPMRFRPGEVKELQVVIDLARWAAGVPGEEKVHRVVLAGTVAARGQQAAVRWEISGRVKSALQVDPTPLQLGIQSARQQRIDRTVAVEAAEGVAELECEASGIWEVNVQRDSPSRFTVAVRSREQLRPGRINDVVHIHPLSPLRKRLPGRKLEIVGEIVHDALPTPRMIYLGRKPCGVTCAESVRLDSLTGQSFRVKEVILPDSEVSARHITEQKSVWTYELSVRVSRSGSHKTSVKFVIEEVAGSEYTLEVPIFYEGLAEPAG